jgi:hypothetical protein
MYGGVITTHPVGGNCKGLKLTEEPFTPRKIGRSRRTIGHALCAYNCIYCSTKDAVRNTDSHFKKFSGAWRIDQNGLNKICGGKPKTFFVCGMIDMLHPEMPKDLIETVLERCRKFPDNTYMFQTRNPARFGDFIESFPRNSIFATTIETNEMYWRKKSHSQTLWTANPDIGMSFDGWQPYSKAPAPVERFEAFLPFSEALHSDGPYTWKTQVTIEPVMEFDFSILTGWLPKLKPDIIYCGPDSGGYGLPEPTIKEIDDLRLWIEQALPDTKYFPKGNITGLKGGK